MIARAYWAPKSSGERRDWEDGFAVSERQGRLAVTDGATWAVQSKLWSQALASAFVDHGPLLAVTDVVQWAGWLADGFVERARAHQNEDWWGGASVDRGAAATLVGLHIDLSGPSGSWMAVAVGDACLFHFSGEEPVRSFPLTSKADFGGRPDLLTTTEPLEVDTVRMAEGTALPGDLFVLASDAIASWIVSALSEPAECRRVLESIRSDTFGPLVVALRQRGLMPDDDVTLVRCHVVEESAR